MNKKNYEEERSRRARNVEKVDSKRVKKDEQEEL